MYLVNVILFLFASASVGVSVHVYKYNFYIFLLYSPFKTETLESIYKSLVVELPKNFADCVKWARFKFQEYYHNTIAQLLHNFPPDQVCQTRIERTLPEIYSKKLS